MIQGIEINYLQAKPFVKWVGGKTQLLPEIISMFPTNISTYVEPFVGGGAVLFWVLKNCPNIKRVVINDMNERLINLYRVVKKNPEKLIKMLRNLEDIYLPLNEEKRKDFYLKCRCRFNEKITDIIEQSALFIFLNRTCFNGLYRENSKGEFNVPHGKYSRPLICDESTILEDSRLLQKVEILNGDFAGTKKYAGKNTLFYLDPPYKPLSETSSFNSYLKESFDDAEQVRLRDFCNEISRKGARFILSNSDPKGKNSEDVFFDELYANFQIKRVFASRMVNANPTKRGKLTELMIVNF